MGCCFAGVVGRVSTTRNSHPWGTFLEFRWSFSSTVQIHMSVRVSYPCSLAGPTPCVLVTEETDLWSFRVYITLWQLTLRCTRKKKRTDFHKLVCLSPTHALWWMYSIQVLHLHSRFCCLLILSAALLTAGICPSRRIYIGFTLQDCHLSSSFTSLWELLLLPSTCHSLMNLFFQLSWMYIGFIQWLFGGWPSIDIWQHLETKYHILRNIKQ